MWTGYCEHCGAPKSFSKRDEPCSYCGCKRWVTSKESCYKAPSNPEDVTITHEWYLRRDGGEDVYLVVTQDREGKRDLIEESRDPKTKAINFTDIIIKGGSR